MITSTNVIVIECLDCGRKETTQRLFCDYKCQKCGSRVIKIHSGVETK